MGTKRKLSFWIIVLGIQIAAAQIPVTDAATSSAVTVNNALTQTNIAKNAGILAKAGATLQTLSNMKKQYDKWTENIEKVTKSIEVGKDVVNIGNLLGEIKKTYSASLSIIKNSYLMDRQDQERVLHVYTKVLNDCISISSDSIDVITDGTYKMNDAERLTFLKDASKKLQKKMALMRYMNKKIKHAEKRVKSNERNNEILNGNGLTIKG